ncbi:MAG TPA: LysR family transcriptional regulator [Rhizomicrobium sp.]
MARDEPKWETYRSFLAVMTQGSLSGAARQLNLTQPTIGRHIDALEADLGLALFSRSQSGLIATQAARELLPHAQAMASAADALVRASSGADAEERGTVRLTASVMVGGEVLPPILTAFREKHPHIAIELVLSDVTADLLRRDADIAVRMLRPRQEALLARKIGRIGLGVHAHRRYLEKHGTPLTLADMAGHAMIGYDKQTAVVQALRKLGMPLKREMFALRTDADLAQLAALRAGFGIGFMQLGIARRDPDLVHILPRLFNFEIEMWLAMHKDLSATRRMRLLFDHLAEGLAAYAATSRAR